MTNTKLRVKSMVQHRVGVGSLIWTLLVVTLVTVGGVLTLHFAPGITPFVAAKILGIAIAVGLDVLALSIAVGIIQMPWSARIRLGLAFSTAEVVMQLLGYVIGNGAGHIIGTVAAYAGFAVLAGVGVFIARESYQAEDNSKLKVNSGWGLLAVSASVSLDSLGIGVSLPGVPLPLIPLLATVAVSTVLFSTVGLVFGERLGHGYRRLAERVAGIVLIVLAVFFTVQHVFGWGT